MRPAHRSVGFETVLKKISVNQLTIGMYLQGTDESWLKHSLWRTRFVIQDQEQLQKIRASGIGACWIDIEQGCDVPAPAAAATLAVLETPVVEAPRRIVTSMAEELRAAALLRRRSAQAMREMFRQVRLGQAIEPTVCAPLVADVVESINRNPDALISLMRLKSADEYTYLHSVTVCALMVALGRQLGMNQEQCRDAGMAGMLHDLGKAAMPQEVLNKPGKLTAEEFDIIKTHPVRGHEMLLEVGGVSESVLDVCRHHHERMDGTGYPDRLAPEQISLIARMGAVCDVYDAVTSDRPYKSGWDPAYAIAQMASWKGHFDTDVFKAFIRSVGIYPTGSLVRMSSGRLGVVVQQNAESLSKPVVKLFFSTNGNVPLKPQLMDLSRPNSTDRITARESPDNWNFKHLVSLWVGDDELTQALGVA
ncbi:MAG: HD-GYP domain-containing protein [Steroidobacteraceae bacterium]